MPVGGAFHRVIKDALNEDKRLQGVGILVGSPI